MRKEKDGFGEVSLPEDALYGTQEVLGKRLKGILRDAYILSVKFPYSGKTKRRGILRKH
jgi:hypothetical protein